jgi:hypothetical protein
MADFWGVLFGLLVVGISRRFLPYFLGRSTRDIVLEPAGVKLPEGWSQLTEPLTEESGRRLGDLERFVFFGALWMSQPIAIGGWLAFKIASKWHAWSSIIRMPDSLGEGVDPVGFLRARLAWSSLILTRSLVGTLFNIAAAVAAVGIGRLIYHSVL